MPVLVNSVDVNASPATVFDYASDLENELEWNRGRVTFIERLTPGPVGVGTRYRAKWPGSPTTEVEYQVFDRPRRWRAYSTARGLEMIFQGEVLPIPGGARVTATMDLRPKGLLRLASPLLARAMQRNEVQTLANFKRTVEGKQTRLANAGADDEGGQGR